jgi:hypothetical protein
VDVGGAVRVRGGALTRTRVQDFYFMLAALNLALVAGTAVLWMLTDLYPALGFRRRTNEIRASHWGASFNASLFLSMAYAFERAGTPVWFQAAFPLGLLVIFTMGMVYNLAPLLNRESAAPVRPSWMRSSVGLLGPLALVYLVLSLIGAGFLLLSANVPDGGAASGVFEAAKLSR